MPNQEDQSVDLWGQAVDIGLKGLDALGYPQRKAKEAVSGDENVWWENFDSKGNQKLPHEAYAALQVGADIVGDPLNFIAAPVKVAAKGAPLLRGAVGSASNYINHFYGPGRDPIVPAFLRDSSPEMQAGFLKVKGLGEWATTSLKGATEHLLDPRSRALAKEQGISTAAVKNVQQHLDNRATDTRAKEKAVSQVQYVRHQNQQGYFKPKGNGKNSAIEEIGARSNLEDYAPASSNALSEAFIRNPVVDSLGNQVSITPQDAKFLGQYLFTKHKKPNTFILKTPVAKETGGHHHDVVMFNPANGALKDAFTKLGENISPKDLAKHLIANQKKFVDKNPKNTWEVLKVDEDGVWLKGGKVGSAVTEGGVMWLTKVKSNGETMTVMADNHDFLEKLGGKVLAPKSLIAVTPPMFNNIKNVRKIKGQEAPRTFTQVPTRKGDRAEDTYNTLLEEIANLKPSKGEVAKQAGSIAADAYYGGRLLGAHEGEDRGWFNVSQNAISPILGTLQDEFSNAGKNTPPVYEGMWGKVVPSPRKPI